MWLYTVEIDGVREEMHADSLAELATKLRGRGKRIKVWSPSGMQLIDTEYGDVYALSTLTKK